MSQILKLLAIETATESCSAALLVNGEVLSISEIAPRRHNEIILSMCENVLAQGKTHLAQLDAIAFGRGPGSFTGVRLAASIAQGIALGQDLPVIPISSLAALAQAAYEQQHATQVFACIDARMQEVYYGLYQVNDVKIMQLISEEIVGPPDRIKIGVSNKSFGVGSGWKEYANSLHGSIGSRIKYDAHIDPQAEFIAKLAQYEYQQGCHVSAVEALPVYLRDNVAEKPKDKIVF